MKHDIIARSFMIAGLALGARAAGAGAQQPVQAVMAPAVAPVAAPAPGGQGGPLHPAPPAPVRAIGRPTVDPFRFVNPPTPTARASAAAAQSARAPQPTLAQNLAATAAPAPRAKAPVAPLAAPDSAVPVSQQRIAPPAPVSRALQPTQTQLLNAPGPRPAGATARCKDGTYLSSSAPTEADCASHAGLGVLFPAPLAAPARPAVRQ